eukprot:CAMPEP_0197843912 /NCGR_PEP_ID=MMETSP1438-20131217/888_1 /TAXON_ID=1461541 /ORGANISM="Pterosperma sp., Strain CCMP1384" /LENGTH=123 /DNA_ID=CAMNT_0043454385 /DNA_START=130 /DNA_END=498 /DNA_ORIENTATION=+
MATSTVPEDLVQDLKKAREKLGKLKVPDIEEIRQLKKPHPLVVKVLESVLILTGRERCCEESCWDDALRFMDDPNFLKTVIEFTPEQVDPQAIPKLASSMSDPKFNSEAVSRVSLVCDYLVQW